MASIAEKPNDSKIVLLLPSEALGLSERTRLPLGSAAGAAPPRTQLPLFIFLGTLGQPLLRWGRPGPLSNFPLFGESLEPALGMKRPYRKW